MKRWYVVVVLLISSFLSIAVQAQTSGDDEKQLIKREIERYKSRLVAQQGTLADVRFDVTYYKLDITVTTSPQYVRGNVLMRATVKENNLAVIRLDLMSALTIDSVKIGSINAAYTQYSESFDVTLDRVYATGEQLEVTVYYRGVPGSSGFGSFEFSSHNSTPWVWSLSEPHGAKDWWPCKDHPSDKADSADIYVTCASAYKVGSNGKLLSVIDKGNGTSTHHWQERYPIPTYLISIAITNYSSFSNWFKYSPTDSMEVLNYVLPEHLSSAQANLPRTVDMLEIYSDLFGLYPFIDEKYGHSEFGWGGGMEHQTMTSLGGFSEGLVAHELAHQWFGDMITCETWPNIWLNEGFATYLTGLYYENQYGTSSYWSYMNSEMSSAKNASGTIYVLDTNNVGTLFDGSLVYAKGATVLHMLRHIMGDTNFFQAMYNYANNPAYKFGTAVTEDFKAECEAVSGTDLDYFFNQWIYGEKYPKYNFGWSSTPNGSDFDISISLSQTSGTTNPVFFTMPIDISFSASGWDTTVTVFNNQQSQTFTVTLSHNPTAGSLDPENWILKGFSKPMTVTPTSLAYGVVYVGTSKRDSVTLTNIGAVPLTISSAVSDLALFTVSPASGIIPANGTMKFYITFTPTGDGSKTGHVTFTNTLGSSEQITVTALGYWPRATYSVAKNWNLVSLPFVPADGRKTTIYPGASSSAFYYEQNSGYIVRDTLLPGIGYWVKFPNAASVTYLGFSRASDTVEVHAGWNLIGSLSSAFASTDVVTEPPGIMLSSFFGYSGGYETSDSLQTASGYWVKVSEDGVLILNPSLSGKGAKNRDAFKRE